MAFVRWRFSLAFGGLTLLAGWGAITLAQEPAKPAAPAKNAEKSEADAPKYIRLLRDDHKDPAALETPIIHFVPKGADRPGLSVDLIGALHVGEKSYYDKLNKQFEKYDAVLYELVAEKNTVPEAGHSSGSPISAIQMGIKNFLELEFQLDCVDYKKKNFVHADMSPEEFSKSMKDRGESVWTIMLKMMAAGMAQQGNGNTPSDLDVLAAFFDKNRAIQMKRILASQFADTEGLLSALDGPQGSTLISERNKAALKVLTEQIKDGKNKKFAIFYGAGHFHDMEKRLINEFDMKRDGEEWLEAWNLRLPGQAAAKNAPPAAGGKANGQPAGKAPAEAK